MILNYPEYLTDLDRESIRKKKVGSRLVLKEEVKRSQRWMKKMSELFKEMITSPYAAVTPTKLLAALTLYRSSLEYANARRDSVTSPNSLPARAPDTASTKFEAAVTGPLGPPVAETKGDEVVRDFSEIEKIEIAKGDLARASMDSEATVVTSGGPEGLAKFSAEMMDVDSDDTPMKNVDVHTSSQENKEVTPHGAEKSGSDSQYPIEPPSRDPPAVPEEDEDAEIPLEYGAQQDVTEVISNFMFQAQCAIKPEGFAPDGEQEDLVKSLFYGKTKTYIQTPKGLRSQEELFNDIKINVASGPQSLHNALDYAHDFQTVSIEDGEAEQYATLSQIPPILQIQVQRVQYDLEKQQAFKSNNHLELKETIYMDRYMDSQDPEIIERRRKVKGWKNQIEALDARRKKLVEFDTNSSVIDALVAARTKIEKLDSLKDGPVSIGEGIDIPASTVAEISGLENLTRDEIAAVDGQRTTLQYLIDHEFDTMRELAYRLYAVFIHSGQVSYGHYWIYIYDFEKKIWRKYNDDYVTEVADVSEIYNEDPRGIASPYFVVYIKDDTKHTLVQPVVRDITPLRDTAHSASADNSMPSTEPPGASSSRNPSGNSSGNKPILASTDSADSDAHSQPSRGRSPPPSYDDITSAGTLSQNNKYSYAPSQCFYQDDDVWSPTTVFHELGNGGDGGGANHPDVPGGVNPNHGSGPGAAAAAALANADVFKSGSPAVMSTTSSRSSRSTNPFRQESGIAARMPDGFQYERTPVNDNSTNGVAAAGAGTEAEAEADADAHAEWWNDDGGSLARDSTPQIRMRRTKVFTLLYVAKIVFWTAVQQSLDLIYDLSSQSLDALKASQLVSSPLKRQQWLARSFSNTTRRYEINKVYPSAAEAIRDMKPNSTLLAGGFGLSGVSDTLILALLDNRSITGLTCVSNNAGVDRAGLGLLLQSGQIKKMIASYVGENKTFEKMYLSGEIELELTPQGTLAERCRAGGAGIPAFYTPAAYGTVVQTGELPLRHAADGTVAEFGQPRDVKVFDGKSYVMEESIKGDYAFVKAYKADRLGNCQFRYASANFNGVMGRNAEMTIVEAENIVDIGDINPNAVHLPGIYVKRVVQSTTPKNIEKFTFSDEPKDMSVLGKGDTLAKRERIVRRAAKEFKNGMYANLGIGMPMLAPSFVDPSISVQLQSENGILGLGPYPKRGQEDPDLINAGKETVTLSPGAACFGSDESFGMIRSGRIDLTILGAMQVSAKGDLANWMLPGKVKGFGGAMDLVSNPSKTRVVVTMEHTDIKGNPKILPQCEFPLTGRNCVSRIITELCVFDVNFSHGLTLIELAEGVTVDEVKAKTGAPFKVTDVVKPML
ncbi:hypothetical protein KEM54_006103 [Ascosphaera aggregata]|nr:hypothetical protein KEM54_006103 [Ascosphaera aggregata]